MNQIILASASPRRKKLLEGIEIDFKVVPSEIDESKIKLDTPIQLVRRLSYLKAQDVASKEDGIIIAADTVVSLEGNILEKPKDSNEAYQMLNKLSGKTHQVITGIAIINQDNSLIDHQATEVTFKHLTQEEIREYITTGEPLDKAGAYGIQGKGALFVKEIKGCFYNVVGLSLFKLAKMLKELGVKIN